MRPVPASCRCGGLVKQILVQRIPDWLAKAESRYSAAIELDQRTIRGKSAALAADVGCSASASPAGIAGLRRAGHPGLAGDRRRRRGRLGLHGLDVSTDVWPAWAAVASLARWRDGNDPAFPADRRSSATGRTCGDRRVPVWRDGWSTASRAAMPVQPRRSASRRAAVDRRCRISRSADAPAAATASRPVR